MIESTLIYRSFYNAAKLMPDEERHLLYDAIFDYSFEGDAPNFAGHPWAASVFEGIRPNIDARNDAVMNGKKGGRPKKETSLSDETKEGFPENKKGGFSETKTGGFENSETKAKAKAKAKAEAKEKRERFTPPTIDEVRAYCRERGNTVDPERFVDFYAAKGWKVGNQPMKDWKACVRTWEGRDRAEKQTRKDKNAFNRFDQREYTESDLEAMLVEVS